MSPFKAGLIAGVILFVETAVEYVFALRVESDTVRFLGLIPMQLLDAGLIMWYYMHVYRLWREEAH